MSLRNIFLKLAHDVSRYPNIVQLTNTLDHGFKEVAAHIQDGGSEVEVTPVYTSGEKLATITVDDVDKDIYMPNGEVKTMEGDSFTTVNGSLVDEMKVGFTPIQSGSGTPSPDNVRPISGHTDVESYLVGRNRLNNTASSSSIRGIDYTVNADKTVDADGLSTQNGGLVVFADSLPSGNYILNGSNNGSASTYCIRYNINGGTNINVYSGDSGIIALTDTDVLTVEIRVYQGATLNHVLFKPMIRLATDTNPAYEPYNGRTYTTSLGDTYYGGDVEQVSGEGEVTYTSVDLGSLSYTYNPNWGGGGLFSTPSDALSNVKTPSTSSEKASALCSIYATYSRNSLNEAPSINGLAIAVNGQLLIRNQAYTDAATFKSAILANLFRYHPDPAAYWISFSTSWIVIIW